MYTSLHMYNTSISKGNGVPTYFIPGPPNFLSLGDSVPPIHRYSASIARACGRLGAGGSSENFQVCSVFFGG